MKVYVVSSVDNYDQYDVSYHLTKKGAYKWIMQAVYRDWNELRWIHPDWIPQYIISEKELRQ